jgi:HAE1 family hydrophobic/amphiphilic exporter-1/multidrug efflux pump
MGTGVVYGMTIATVVGLFIIPVCYVFVQRLSERGKPPVKVASPTPASEGTHGGSHS